MLRKWPLGKIKIVNDNRSIIVFITYNFTFKMKLAVLYYNFNDKKSAATIDMFILGQDILEHNAPFYDIYHTFAHSCHRDFARFLSVIY